MIDFLLALLSESPLLFVILLVNLLIVAYIIFRISLYIVHKQKPGQTVSRFIWKIKTKREKKEINTLEDAYRFVMEDMKKEGLLEKHEETGFRSRKKLLQNIPEGGKRKILESLFELYEAKVYGNRGIKNEKNLVAGILDSCSKP